MWRFFHKPWHKDPVIIVCVIGLRYRNYRYICLGWTTQCPPLTCHDAMMPRFVSGLGSRDFESEDSRSSGESLWTREFRLGLVLDGLGNFMVCLVISVENMFCKGWLESNISLENNVLSVFFCVRVCVWAMQELLNSPKRIRWDTVDGRNPAPPASGIYYHINWLARFLPSTVPWRMNQGVVSNIFIFTVTWGRFPIWLAHMFQMGGDYPPTRWTINWMISWWMTFTGRFRQYLRIFGWCVHSSKGCFNTPLWHDTPLNL